MDDINVSFLMLGGFGKAFESPFSEVSSTNLSC